MHYVLSAYVYTIFCRVLDACILHEQISAIYHHSFFVLINSFSIIIVYLLRTQLREQNFHKKCASQSPIRSDTKFT